MTSKLITQTRGSTGFLVLNAPHRRNAISLDMWQAIPDCVAVLAQNGSLRCIVVMGAGTEAFSAGADISEFENARADENTTKSYEQATMAATSSIEHCPLPVIAAIQGICFGGGMALSMSCDVRIASDDARFCIPAAKLGIAYGLKGTQTLVGKLGPSLTAEMLMSARVYTADEAVTSGIIRQVFLKANFAGAVEEYASRFADLAPLTIQASKIAIRASLSQSIEAVRDANLSAERCATSLDYSEGRRSFLEKRKPSFQGH